MPQRVLLAGLFHETHTFLEGRTRLADFDERLGEQLWSAENDGTVFSFARRVGRCEPSPTISSRPKCDAFVPSWSALAFLALYHRSC